MCVVVNFDALAQASDTRIEMRIEKLSSCAECRIRTQGLRHQLASRLNVHWQTDWAIETARLDDQRAFSPLDPTVSWLSYLALAICMYVVVNLMLSHRQAIIESKGDKLSSSAECRIRTQSLRHPIASRLNNVTVKLNFNDAHKHDSAQNRMCPSPVIKRWIVIKWAIKNNVRWNFNQNTRIIVQKMHLKCHL